MDVETSIEMPHITTAAGVSPTYVQNTFCLLMNSAAMSGGDWTKTGGRLDNSNTFSVA